MIFDYAGNLYGITGNWWSSTSVVYELVPQSGGGWTKRSLHRSNGQWGSIFSNAGLTFDSVGNLYGTTIYGGLDNFGIVFKMTPNGSGGWNYQRLHIFEGKPGENPAGKLLIDAASNIYGTTFGSGVDNCGTVFEITP